MSLQSRDQEWMEGDDFNTEAVMNICGECNDIPLNSDTPSYNSKCFSPSRRKAVFCLSFSSIYQLSKLFLNVFLFSLPLNLMSACMQTPLSADICTEAALI